MEEKKINRLIKEYDNYLDSLRHVSCLSLDNKRIRASANNIESKSIESYLNPKINHAHEQVINSILKKSLYKGLVLSDLKDIRNFVIFPDFKVLTHIDNPANIFKNISSIEKTVIIAPVYELNLILNDSKDSKYTSILSLKRLVLGPCISIISETCTKVNTRHLEVGTNRLQNQFRTNVKSSPNKDDLILLRSMVIKYLLEGNSESIKNTDLLSGDIVYPTYDYIKTKMDIYRKYKVKYADQYKTKSKTNSPWIFDGLDYFDNRELEGNNKRLMPISYQREKNRS